MKTLQSLIEKYILPDPHKYFGEWGIERYNEATFGQNLRYWFHNWPGFSIKLGKRNGISFLEGFEGHPYDRVYIRAGKWFIMIAPFSKIAGNWHESPYKSYWIVVEDENNEQRFAL